jgi:hypothetical protein
MFRTLARAAAVTVFSAALLAPLAASAALSSAQIQSVVSMLQAFGVDQPTIDSVSAALAGTSSGSSSSASCISLSYNLYAGQTDAATGGQVSQLQQFLGVSPTGYFGPLTEQAVQQYQSNNGIVSSGSPDTTGYGFVGPQTRAALSCNGSAVAYANTGTNTTTTGTTYAPTTSSVTTSGASGTPTIVFDQSSLTSTSPSPVITGTAQGVSQIRIDIYGHTSITATVANGVWQAPVTESLGYGVYSVQAVDLSSSRILASSALVIKSSAVAVTNPTTTSAAANTVPQPAIAGVPVVVPSTTNSTTPQPTVTIGSASTNFAGQFVVSGTAANTTSLLVYALPPAYTGARDFATIAANAGNTSVAYAQRVQAPSPNPVPVQNWNQMWFAYFAGPLPAGTVVAVFDSTAHNLITYIVVGGGGSYSVNGASGGENGGGETVGGNDAPGSGGGMEPGGPDFGGAGTDADH